MIIDEIKKANFLAMKNKDEIAKGILSYVYSEYKYLEMDRKFANLEIGDVDTVAILQKAIKELNESLQNYRLVNNQQKIEEQLKKIKIIEVFLPKMLTKEEIKSEIDKLEDKSIASIMRHFKTNFAGKCNMAEVNQVAKMK